MGSRRVSRFDVQLPPELTQLPDLSAHLRSLLAQIPAGRVSTYGRLAEALGDRIASRWVGHYLLHHPHDEFCPCHRVVRSDGSLGGYVTGRSADKSQALSREGIDVGSGTIDLQRYASPEFCGERPLLRLRQIQQQLLPRLSLSDPGPLERVAGVDVSYQGELGVAAYAEVDARQRSVVNSLTVGQPVRFPYISSFLAFRELPLLLELLYRARQQCRLADVLLVDGAGIAHPRRSGVATLLGILADVPTVGLTKKRLHGQVDCHALRFGQVRPIWDGQELIGHALLPWPKTSQPLYVSPGHRMTVDLALEVVQRFLGHHLLPDPIYWADRLSRAAARRAGPLKP